MLFRKKMPADCWYCIHSAKLGQESSLLCSKYGIVERKEKCRKFKYDPYKRIPLKPKTIDFSKYEDKDFTL